mgnify:CR=1 FL=1
MKADLSLTDLRPLEGNPRRLSDTDRERLVASLERFGDLSGIVVNRREGAKSNGSVVGGNQRTLLLGRDQVGQVTITDRLEKPNRVGTIAWGYADVEGERFTYREVDWSDEMVREAAVKANLLGGDWNFEQLSEEFEPADLMEWGFEPWEIKAHAPEIDLNTFETGSGPIERDREGAPAVGEGGRSKLRMPGFVRLEFHVKLETRDLFLDALGRIKEENDSTFEDAIVRLVNHYNSENLHE